MIDAPRLVQPAARSAAVIHVTVPRDDIRNAMGAGYRELMAVLAAQGIAPAGAWFTRHLRLPGETFDFEIGVPVARAVTAAGRVTAGELPAATVARTVHHGPYEGLAQGWAELMAWIAAEGHAPASELWEVYVAGPETGADESRYRTELNRPVVAAKT